MSTTTYTLSDVSETSDDGDLAGKHDIRGTLDTVNKRLSATVLIQTTERAMSEKETKDVTFDFEFR